MRELELLAPARNVEIGIAAIDCGADAVYLAGPAFGARQAAGNSVEDIRRLCSYAHRYGARVFVTLNTIIFDSELEDALALAVQMQEAGADALIVQDFALPAFEAEHPERLSIPLHASTQCSIRTVEDARRMDALGFSRIVLERELPMATVREICSAVNCEVEAFVHGALCVCYSGECYLSEMLSGRSANRGECVQACRSRYDLVDALGKPVANTQGKTLATDRTLLSLRDLNLLDRLPEMAGGGVGSFKIEGRLKNISYVRNIVAAYSQALDRIVAGHPDKYRRASFGHVERGFTPAPSKSFNRGFTQLFFDGRRGRWACLDAGKALGEEVGTVSAAVRTKGGVRISVKPARQAGSNPDSNIQTAGRDASGYLQFHNGDGFSFIGPDGREAGFRADVCEGNTIFCRAADGLVPGTKLHRNLDTSFEKELERGAVRRIAVGLSVEISGAGTGADCGTCSGADHGTFRAACGHFTLKVLATSEDGREILYSEEIEAEPARNRERMFGMISGQLGKDAGIYRFSVSGIACGEDIPMMSAAQLNGIRRAVAEKLDSLPCKSRPMNRASIRNCLPEPLKFHGHISYKKDVANALAAGFYRRLGAETVEPSIECANRGLSLRDCSENPQIDQKEKTAQKENGDRHTHGDNCKLQEGGEPELMRSKYCLLHELGICRKTPAYKAFAAARDLSGGLFLRNNGRLLRLEFDCRNCEMVILPAR